MPADPKGPITINGITIRSEGGMLLDPAGQEIALRPKSAAVLAHLAANPDRTVTKDELMRAVWPGVAVTDDSLVQCVREIRRVLRDDLHTILQTVPKRGYRLVVPQRTAGRLRRRPILLAGGTTLLLAITSFYWMVGNRAAPTLDGTVVILPLSPSLPAPTAANEAIDSVAHDLAVLPGVQVIDIRPSSVQPGRDPSLTRQDLGNGYVLSGSASGEGNRLRMELQLDDARHRRCLWIMRFGGTIGGARRWSEAVVGRILASMIGHDRPDALLARSRQPD